MKIKVCGLKNPENIQELARLPIDYMGFIFYSKSPRYIGKLNPKTLDRISEDIQKVGVFVNKPIEEILDIINEYKLDLIQLHGEENPEYCKQLIEASGKEIIKAFNVLEVADLARTHEFEGIVKYFLFDTKSDNFGGSGKQFNWKILEEYNGSTPFFLSGGILPKDVDKIKKLKYPQLFGIDLNSQFESEPGLKDTRLVDEFISRLKNKEKK